MEEVTGTSVLQSALSCVVCYDRLCRKSDCSVYMIVSEFAASALRVVELETLGVAEWSVLKFGCTCVQQLWLHPDTRLCAVEH